MPNEWVSTIDTTNNQFVYTYTADEAKPSPTGYNLILSTENKFVDKNIKIKTIIPAGSLSGGNTTVSASSNVTLLGSVQNSAPTGNYISVTGQGTVSASTAGWIAANASGQSTSKTVYYPLQSAQFDWGTGANANKVYCTTAGYVSANNSTAIIEMNTTSVVQTNVTTISGTTATGATATWGTGYITSGSIAAATFTNEPAQGKTAASYVDISDTTAAPVLISQDFLYINRGYVDNIKISLAKLIPDSATKPTGASSYAEGLLSGYALYDGAGNLVTGNIPTKTSSDLDFDTTYGIFTTPTGYYASDATKTIGIATVTPAIANPTTVLNTYFEKLANSTGASVTITPQYTNTNAGYLSAHTTAQNGTALYYKIRTATFNDNSNSGNVALNYDADANNLSIYRNSSNTGGVSISASAPASNSGKVYIKVTGSGTVTAATAGWITEGGVTATGSKVMYISLNKYDGSFTTI